MQEIKRLSNWELVHFIVSFVNFNCFHRSFWDIGHRRAAPSNYTTCSWDKAPISCRAKAKARLLHKATSLESLFDWLVSHPLSHHHYSTKVHLSFNQGVHAYSPPLPAGAYCTFDTTISTFPEERSTPQPPLSFREPCPVTT